MARDKFIGMTFTEKLIICQWESPGCSQIRLNKYVVCNDWVGLEFRQSISQINNSVKFISQDRMTYFIMEEADGVNKELTNVFC
jgi:hypothetical protein